MKELFLQWSYDRLCSWRRVEEEEDKGSSNATDWQVDVESPTPCAWTKQSARFIDRRGTAVLDRHHLDCTSGRVGRTFGGHTVGRKDTTKQGADNAGDSVDCTQYTGVHCAFFWRGREGDDDVDSRSNSCGAEASDGSPDNESNRVRRHSTDELVASVSDRDCPIGKDQAGQRHDGLKLILWGPPPAIWSTARERGLTEPTSNTKIEAR